MTDFHSHILPRVDDGSKSVAESIELLDMLKTQGVGNVIATPHFNANRMSVGEFLSRRDEALSLLVKELPEGAPNVLCGAEVGYYPGISRLGDLNRLCASDSKLLLLEMSMSKWTEYTVRELTELVRYGDVTLVIAHIERYMKYQDRKAIDRLYESGILMQSNASFFLGFSTKRKALSMLRNGEIHLIGSDCHSVGSRPPRIGEAFNVIRKKLGEDFLVRFNEYGESVLSIN